MAFLEPKFTEEIRDKLVSWLNDNLDDPYEQVTQKKRGDNSAFVHGGDHKIVKVFPRIHVAIADFVYNKHAVQSKTQWMDEEEHHFMIYYRNQKAHKYTFLNGKTLIDEAQCRRYLQQIQKQLKANMTDFNDWFHSPVFGTIPNPEFKNGTSAYVSMLPMTVKTYRR